jgi:hypothetical protein
MILLPAIVYNSLIRGVDEKGVSSYGYRNLAGVGLSR